MASADWVARKVIGRPFFYGWLIVLITFTTAMTTAGISGYGLSFFIVPMSEELGISRTQFSAIAVFRLALLPLLPFLGMLVDRKHGPRLLVTIGSIIAGLVLMSTSLVQELWQFYLMYGVIFGLAMFSMGGQLVGPLSSPSGSSGSAAGPWPLGLWAYRPAASSSLQWPGGLWASLDGARPGSYSAYS